MTRMGWRAVKPINQSINQSWTFEKHCSTRTKRQSACMQTQICPFEEHSRCVHTWISKPIPIRIALTRMTFHSMDSYFKHESRLSIWQSLDPD